jgi:putative sterol carrier protein
MVTSTLFGGPFATQRLGMAKFPSDEWLKAYMEKLNSNAVYEDAGKNWEGAMTFVVQKDASFDKDAYMYLDLYHGKCRDAKFSFAESELPVPEYKYSGPYANWRKLINKEIDPIQGLLTGKFKLQGSMMKVMRFTKAAKEMVNTTAMVQTEF